MHDRGAGSRSGNGSRRRPMVLPRGGAAVRARAGRWWPEAALAAFACVIFLGFLGSPELWGKREQRAAAQALDTVENGRWLGAQIQGRPRLEKPPLPRWSIAVLLGVTGCRSEWVVRLPGALAALATAALTYGLGRRMGGRRLALASATVLCTNGLFVSEFRQAGNDGPLGLCTTLALYAAWRRLNGHRGATWIPSARTDHRARERHLSPPCEGGTGGGGGRASGDPPAGGHVDVHIAHNEHIEFSGAWPCRVHPPSPPLRK